MQGPEKPPHHRVLRRHDADVNGALLPDAVAGEQLLKLVDEGRERPRPLGDLVGQPVRQVARDTAGAEVVTVIPGARDRLVELEQLLALLEAPQARRDRPHIERVSRDVEQMVQHTRDLREQGADPLGARRGLNAEQLLLRQHPGVLHAHRADVVEPVEVGQRLQVCLVLDQLLGAAVQQADVRVGALHHLAVHLQDQAQHAVRRRVLRPEVDGVVVDLDHLAGARLVLARRRGVHAGDDVEVLARAQIVHHGSSFAACLASMRATCAFSSPGNVVMPSQGETKSKLRKSCVRTTGSLITCLRSSS